MVESLQRLFAYLIRSDRRYIDPTTVLSTLSDESGKQITIGDEKDVGEFNMLLIARIEDGLRGSRPANVPIEGSPAKASIDVSGLIRKDSFTGRDESAVIDSAVVSSLFYGLQHEETWIKEGSSRGRITDSKEVLFGQFILHVENKDLYTAWDRAMSVTIDGYISAEGERLQADNDVWITKAPQILLFQISRVDFDKSSQMPVKSNKKFTFPKILHPDRFLIENKALSTDLRVKLTSLRKKVERLEKVLEQFENFRGSQATIGQVLGLAGNFLRDQAQPNEYMETEDSSVHVYSPGRLGFDREVSPPQLSDIEKLLVGYKDRIEEMIGNMKLQLKQCNEDIQSVFDRHDLTKHPYQLHSILIHDGQAGSGHYFACIYEPETTIWRRYSDINVTEISEAEVMTEAFGGHHYASAYCLMYIDTRLVEQMGQGKKLRSYSLAQALDQHPDVYSSFVPHALALEVDEDNVKQKSEIIDWKTSSISRAIHDAYQIRHTQATTQWQSFRSKSTDSIKHELINFAIFMRIKGEETISNWFILDTCMREFDEEHRSIRDLQPMDPLYKKIIALSFKPRIFLYNDESVRIGNALKDFENAYKFAIMDEYVMRKMNEFNYFEAFFGLSSILTQTFPEKTEYQTQPKELTKLLALHLSSMLNKCVYQRDFRRACVLVGLLAVLTTMYLDPFQPYYSQVERNVKWTVDYMQKHCAEDYTGEVQERFEKAFSSISKQEFEPFFDLALSIAELDAVNEQCRSFSGNVWIEGWKSHLVPSRYAHELARLKKNYEIWVAWEALMKQTHVVVTESQKLDYEARAGIQPPR